LRKWTWRRSDTNQDWQTINRETQSVEKSQRRNFSQRKKWFGKWQKLYANGNKAWTYWDEKYYDLVVNTYSLNKEEALDFVLGKSEFQKPKYPLASLWYNNDMTKLAIIILLFSFFIGFQKSFAQSTPSAQIINVQYDLPYTGILPDNPLYFLKALRDNIYGMLITDPIKNPTMIF